MILELGWCGWPLAEVDRSGVEPPGLSILVTAYFTTRTVLGSPSFFGRGQSKIERPHR